MITVKLGGAVIFSLFLSYNLTRNFKNHESSSLVLVLLVSICTVIRDCNAVSWKSANIKPQHCSNKLKIS